MWGPLEPGGERARAAAVAHVEAEADQIARLIACYGHVPAEERERTEAIPVFTKRNVASFAHWFGFGWRSWAGIVPADFFSVPRVPGPLRPWRATSATFPRPGAR